MTIGDIIKAVRWCIDEEAVNAAEIADVSAFDYEGGAHTDIGLMDNIIKHKILSALRWVCLYAPSEQLGGSGSAADIDIIHEDVNLGATDNTITPTKTLVRVVRVKGTGWHRAILGDSLIKEDSDEYLQLRDVNGAEATKDRPQAALVNTKEKKVEVWPAESGDKFSLTYITTLSASDISGLDEAGWEDIEVGVPPSVETSFIYYLAFLLLSAYDDGRAKSMYEIALLSLGKTEDKQRQ